MLRPPPGSERARVIGLLDAFQAAERAGVDGAELLARLREEAVASEARAALRGFLRAACPGVPTFVVAGRRYFGKDRVEWAIADAGPRA